MTAPDVGAEIIRGRLMKASLGALLDRVRGSRDALPHLAALETNLGKMGAAAIEALPERWRVRMAAQLGSLPLPEDDAPLQDLRRRLTASLALDRPEPGSAPPARPPAVDDSFDPERTVVVRELTHSEFMNLTDGQEGGLGDAGAQAGKPREDGTR